MPLMKGSSDAIISENIREMMHSGHSQKQAIAAAYNQAGRGKKRRKKHGMKKFHTDTDREMGNAQD